MWIIFKIAKKILNELIWHPKKSLENVEVVYVHRGAPDDRMKIRALDIIDLGKSFFVIKIGSRDTHIPYHQISEIRRVGETLWRKNARRDKSK